MKITDFDIAEEYLYGMKTIVPETPVEQSRWSTFFEQIVQDEETGKFFKLEWESGSTEYQEVDFELTVTEVEPYDTIITRYRKVQSE